MAYDDADFGTKDNPLPDQQRKLDNIPDDIGSDTFFRQTHDIDAGLHTGYLGADNFADYFDGRGYLIENLTSGSTLDTCTGLF